MHTRMRKLQVILNTNTNKPRRKIKKSKYKIRLQVVFMNSINICTYLIDRFGDNIIDGQTSIDDVQIKQRPDVRAV